MLKKELDELTRELLETKESYDKRLEAAKESLKIANQQIQNTATEKDDLQSTLTVKEQALAEKAGLLKDDLKQLQEKNYSLCKDQEGLNDQLKLCQQDLQIKKEEKQ